MVRAGNLSRIAIRDEAKEVRPGMRDPWPRTMQMFPRSFTAWAWSTSDRLLSRIIHEHFCYNRRSAATTSLRSAGSPFGPSTYCTSTLQVLRAPRAALATRLSDFATNCH